MKVTIDGREYRADTAVGLINEIKGMHWQAGDNATPEEYIAVQERTYQKMTRRKLRLPKGDTETRAMAMFEKLGETGAWIYSREG